MLRFLKSTSRDIFYIPALFLILLADVPAEPPETALYRINVNKKYFIRAAQYFDVNIFVLAAVTFVERTLNHDWSDDALDVILARSGKNSSIGFCQVKLKTAYWIEKQLADSSSMFYPGEAYQQILPVSKSPKELIAKLIHDSLNIHYAAAYLCIIQSYWQRAGFPIADRPDILGTLYSTGLYRRNGELRLPHAHPKPNFFGEEVLKVLEKGLLSFDP
jgi:hypothetical protein